MPPLCQERGVGLFQPWAPPVPILLTPLLYHNLGGLSRGFLHFFSMTGTYQAFLRTFPYHRTQCRGPLGRGALYLPLTPIVYHRPHTKSIGNVAQIRDFLVSIICAFCELTFCGGRVIIKIRAQTVVGARPKIKAEFPRLSSSQGHQHFQGQPSKCNGSGRASSLAPCRLRRSSWR